LPFAFKLSMFTDGTTNGPIAAGVKSTTFLLRLLRIEALCICALAEVASKNISAILGFSVSASIPLEYLSIPFFFACCKPSDAFFSRHNFNSLLFLFSQSYNNNNPLPFQDVLINNEQHYLYYSL